MPTSPNKVRQEFDAAVFDGLLATLAELPELQFRDAARPDSRGHADTGVDLIATAEVDGQSTYVLIQTKSSGYPRDVRHAASQLKMAAAQYPLQPATALVAAPALSPGSREYLRREGVGYWDTGGSVYLKLPNALYYVDRPPPKVEQRRLRSVFRGKTAQVLHALLLQPERQWGVRELASQAEASPYTVHEVFTYLEEQLWVERHGTGPGVTRELTEPGALLDAWAEAHSLKEYDVRRLHGWAQSPAALRRSVAAALERAQVPYALTLSSGAELVAPLGTATEQLSVLVPSTTDPRTLSQVTNSAQLHSVDEGETVRLLLARDRSPLLFRREVERCWVASNVQLYLDLWAWPRRGKEQARHLRSEMLPY